ncbi:MAG: MFS transporter [Promethearchaeota archaeon]|nr:MAG: MFS transporter [Candidatus Lokiarchaeota archaeon]
MEEDLTEIDPNQKTYKQYLFFWSGQLFSLFGSNVISFVIMWWLTVITGNEIIVTLAYFFNFVPLVVLTPIAGVLADKFSRKKIILVADSLQAFFTFLLVIAFFFNLETVWFAILINGIRGICQAFHQPTANAIIPSMVPQKKLTRINGINFLFTGVVQLTAQVAAGFLWEILGPNNISLMLMIDVLTFFIALIPLLIVTIPQPGEVGEKESFTFLKDFKEGIATLRFIPGLVIILFLAMLVNFLIKPLDTLLTLFIYEYHNGDALFYSLVGAVVQFGMIIGAIIVSIKEEWNNKIKWMFGGIIIAMGGFSFMGIAPPGAFIWIVSGGIIFALFIPIINTLFQTIMQSLVPKDKMGRVSSIANFLSMLISPLGIIISGPLGALLGIPILYFICGLIGIIITLLTWFFSGIRHINYEKLLEEKNNKNSKEIEKGNSNRSES